MRKNEHLFFAWLFCLVFISISYYFSFHLFTFSFKSILIMVSLVSLYSLLPDTDNKGSFITHLFFGLGIAGVIFGLIQLILNFHVFTSLIVLSLSVLFLLVVYVSSNFFKHRGIIHSIPVGLLSIIPIWLLFFNIGYCFLGFIAWYTHLLGDGYIFKLR